MKIYFYLHNSYSCRSIRVWFQLLITLRISEREYKIQQLLKHLNEDIYHDEVREHKIYL